MEKTTKAIKQGPQAIDLPMRLPRTAADFVLTIPCEPAKGPDRIKPLLLVEENEFGGPERGVYQCEQCTRIFETRKAWEKHAGMVPNIMGTCKGG